MKTPIALPIDQINKFCQHWQIIELSLFGSILRDDFHADSDIDILEDVLKVEASQKLRKSSDHDPNHRYVDKSFGSFHKPFIIFAQAPTPVEPSKCSLNHPPFW